MVCGAAAEEQNKCSSAFGRVEQASCRDTQARFTHATSPAVYIYDARGIDGLHGPVFSLNFSLSTTKQMHVYLVLCRKCPAVRAAPRSTATGDCIS